MTADTTRPPSVRSLSSWSTRSIWRWLRGVRPDEPLFGEGLGLDSIDALEIALAISRTYGVELRSDDDQVQQVFARFAI